MRSQRLFSTHSYFGGAGIPKKAQLPQAVSERDLAKVKQLLADGHTTISRNAFYGASPIVRSAANGSTDILSELLEHARKTQELNKSILDEAFDAAYKAKDEAALTLLLKYNAKVPLKTIPEKSSNVREDKVLATGSLVTGAFTAMTLQNLHFIGEHYKLSSTAFFGVGFYYWLRQPVPQIPDYGMSKLHLAAGKGDKLEARMLLHSNPHLINKLCVTRMSAAHIAAQYDQVGILKLLATEGADLNIKDILGETPLVTAIRHNSIEAKPFLKACSKLSLKA